MITYASNFKDTQVFQVELSKHWEADQLMVKYRHSLFWPEIKLSVSDMHIILPEIVEIFWKKLTKSIRKNLYKKTFLALEAWPSLQCYLKLLLESASAAD